MVLRLTILAHEATEATHAARFAAPDDPLSRVGRGAAERAAGVSERVPDGLSGDDSGASLGTGVAASSEASAAKAAVMSAPEDRCLETARLRGIEVGRTEEVLADLDVGRWVGLEQSALAPEEVMAWAMDPTFDGHGGESLVAYLARTAEYLDALPEPQGSARTEPVGSARTVVVAHPATIRAAVLHALSAPAHAFWRVDAGPGTRVDLHRRSGRWTLRLPGDRG